MTSIDDAIYGFSSEQSMNEIKNVFDMYDTEKQGFISRSSLSQIGKNAGLSNEQSDRITEFFDPHNKGIITFDDFKRLSFYRDLSQWDADFMDEKNTTAAQNEEDPREPMAGVASPLRALSPTDSGFDIGHVEERFECYVNDDASLVGSSDTLNNNNPPCFSEGDENGCGRMEDKNNFTGRNSWSRTSIRKSIRSPKSASRKDLSAAAVANASFNSAHRSSLLFGPEENDNFDQAQLVEDLSSKVQNLEVSLSGYVEDLSISERNVEKAQRENATLVQKIRHLEETLKDVELKADETLAAEREKNRQALEKLDRERKKEIGRTNSEILELQGELSRALGEVGKLESRTATLQTENDDLSRKVQDTSEELYRAIDELVALKTDQARKDELAQRAQETTKEDVATKESTPNPDMTAQYNSMIAEVERLRQENRSLKQTNEELEEELMGMKIDEGHRLIDKSTVTHEANWAAESDNLTTLSREELLTQLTHQKDTNLHLKEYIGTVLSDIILTYPQVLEKKI